MGLALRDCPHLRGDSKWQPNFDRFGSILIQWADVWPRSGSSLYTIQALGFLAVDLDTLPKNSAASISVVSRADNWHNAAAAISSQLARNTGNLRARDSDSGVGRRVEMAAVDFSKSVGDSVQCRVDFSIFGAGTGSDEPFGK